MLSLYLIGSAWSKQNLHVDDISDIYIQASFLALIFQQARELFYTLREKCK